jgi:uncharacterized protein (UPF0333 family)
MNRFKIVSSIIVLVFSSVVLSAGYRLSEARAVASAKSKNNNSCRVINENANDDYESYLFECGNKRISVICDVKEGESSTYSASISCY